MTKRTIEKINNMVKVTYSAIAKCVKTGQYAPEFEGEQPTRARIKHSVRLAVRGCKAYGSMFKTKCQYEMFDEMLYTKLRKNGILAKMRG